MCMDKLIAELLTLLRELLATQQRLIALALTRRDAMRAFDIERLNSVALQEHKEMQIMTLLDGQRKNMVAQFRALLGKNIEPTVSEIAKRAKEPVRTQLLTLAGQLKEAVEQLERNTRINATVSESVVKGLAKVLKVVTGLAQHGIHLLELTA
jgi:FlgN protein